MRHLHEDLYDARFPGDTHSSWHVVLYVNNRKLFSAYIHLISQALCISMCTCGTFHPCQVQISYVKCDVLNSCSKQLGFDYSLTDWLHMYAYTFSD